MASDRSTVAQRGSGTNENDRGVPLDQEASRARAEAHPHENIGLRAAASTASIASAAARQAQGQQAAQAGIQVLLKPFATSVAVAPVVVTPVLAVPVPHEDAPANGMQADLDRILAAASGASTPKNRSLLT